jgi:ABC-type antimicrobial peptide transport system permease subunit
VGSAIIILTVISIFNSYLIIVNNRSYSFSLKRVIGFSKLRIVLEFAGEAALIGLILGFAGYFFGFYCVDYISRNIGNVIPAMKGIAIIKPAKNLMLLSITFATAVSAMSALVPAVIASNINLFKSVGK